MNSGAVDEDQNEDYDEEHEQLMFVVGYVTKLEGKYTAIRHFRCTTNEEAGQLLLLEGYAAIVVLYNKAVDEDQNEDYDEEKWEANFSYGTQSRGVPVIFRSHGHVLHSAYCSITYITTNASVSNVGSSCL